MTVSVFFQSPRFVHIHLSRNVYILSIYIFILLPQVSNIVWVLSPGCKILIGEEKHLAKGTCLNGTEVGKLGLFWGIIIKPIFVEWMLGNGHWWGWKGRLGTAWFAWADERASVQGIFIAGNSSLVSPLRSLAERKQCWLEIGQT